MVPLLILLFLSRFMQIQPVKQFNIVFAAERPQTPEETHYAYNFYSFYARAMGPLHQAAGNRLLGWCVRVESIPLVPRCGFCIRVTVRPMPCMCCFM